METDDCHSNTTAVGSVVYWRTHSPPTSEVNRSNPRPNPTWESWSLLTHVWSFVQSVEPLGLELRLSTIPVLLN